MAKGKNKKTRSIVFKILDDHGFIESEYNDVFEAMSEILERAADSVKEKEPYATMDIERLKQVSSDICDIDSFIESYKI